MSTTALKLIALALMFLDHIYEFIPGAPLILTILGRISAPVFLFCCVWGFHYTHSRPVYLARMYLCSGLMGVLDGVLNTSVAQPYQFCTNNIFSTLFITCMFLYLWEKAEKPGKKVLMVLAYLGLNLASLVLARLLLVKSSLAADLGAAFGWDYAACYLAVSGFLPNAITCEGSFLVVLMGLVLHFCKGSKKSLCLGYGLYCGVYLGILVCMGLSMPSSLSSGGWVQFLFRDAIQWLQILALPLMLLYNGQRGRGIKYLFYVFYPLHIAVLFYLGNYLAA